MSRGICRSVLRLSCLRIQVALGVDNFIFHPILDPIFIEGVSLQNRVENRVGDPIFHPILDPILDPIFHKNPLLSNIKFVCQNLCPFLSVTISDEKSDYQ